MPAHRPPDLTKSHYERLSELRHSLQRFLQFSQDAARDCGLTPRQHQALLAIKGFPNRDYVSIRELAGRLHLRHQSVVGLVDRLVRRQLARRTPSRADRRQVEVRLTPRGEALIGRLSATHWRELRQSGPDFRRALNAVLKP